MRLTLSRKNRTGRFASLRWHALKGMSAAFLVMTGTVSHSPAATFDRATTNYLTHCGGCHGIEGIAARTFVPQLRDRVGVFTCSAEGRAYLGRVPGVSMSLIRGDQDLADVLNFVLFRMGGTSTSAGTQPYSAAEVHNLRANPIETTNFMETRAMILRRALALCPRSGK